MATCEPVLSQHDALLERDAVLDSFFWLRRRDPAMALDYLRFWRRNPAIASDFDEIAGGQAEWAQLREQELLDGCEDEPALLPPAPATQVVRDLAGQAPDVVLAPVEEWQR